MYSCYLLQMGHTEMHYLCTSCTCRFLTILSTFEFITICHQSLKTIYCITITGVLRPPGGSITVFSTLFNKADLLSLYAFTLDPYNPMVLYPTGPLKFPSSSQCIRKHSPLSFQYLVHGENDSANTAQPTVKPLNRH